MINVGTAQLDHWADDWTAVTLDGKRSAQFEETILCVLLPFCPTILLGRKIAQYRRAELTD